jgi:transcriptional regulator with XRE-family HTH domain
VGNTNITGRLKAIRLTLGLNQKEFGEQIGMALTTWASIEQGRNSLNERARLLLEKIYLVNPEYLDNGEGPMFLRQVRNENQDIFPERAFPRNLLFEDPSEISPKRNIRSQIDFFESSNQERNIYASMAAEPESAGKNIPCPDCREKDMENYRLRQLVERLESEVSHQRKVIDHLMEVQKNQNKPI